MKNKLAIFLLTIVFLGIGTIASAAERNFTFTPQVGIPGSDFQVDKSVAVGETKNGTTSSTLLANYINSFYIYALNILGVLAVLILMAGGVQWIVSGGNTKKIDSAKKMISGSLFGGFLLLGSYFILNTINPNLTKLPAIEMKSMEYVGVGCCDKAIKSGKAEVTSSTNCKETDFHPSYGLSTSGQCTPYICCLEYDGKSSGTVKSCSNKLEADCQSDEKNKRETFSESCSDVNECSGAKMGDTSCQGVVYGGKPNKAPQNKSLGELALINYWCYNGKLYTDITGREGEPCGTSEGARCFKKDQKCKDVYEGEGRNCAEYLVCCQE